MQDVCDQVADVYRQDCCGEWHHSSTAGAVHVQIQDMLHCVTLRWCSDARKPRSTCISSGPTILCSAPSLLWGATLP